MKMVSPAYDTRVVVQASDLCVAVASCAV